jgi:hypothetical protein
MRRLLTGLSAAAVVAVAVAWSGPGGPRPEFDFPRQERNPVSSFRLNNDPGEFQFAIVSDRTGGHRPGVFSRAVEKLNLLQPEFVLSIGDLIEGGQKPPKTLDLEWKEFDRYVARLQMPFFYVPGNHDYATKNTAAAWDERFGRSYYHFVYKGVLFLCLNTDDPPGTTGHIGKEQVRYSRDVLDANRDVRWTVVALHRPLWTLPRPEATGLTDVEAALGTRPYTVFAGHVHRYQKFARQGRSYYQLATTGGASKMRGVDYREFDHVVWVTMKRSGPVLANLLLDGVLSDDLTTPPSDEAGVSTANRLPTHPVRGRLVFEGAPVAGVWVVFRGFAREVKRPVEADGMTAEDGSFTLSTYTAGDGLPEGEYTVTAVLYKPRTDAAGKPGPNQLPARYATAETSRLKVTITPGANEVNLLLER